MKAAILRGPMDLAVVDLPDAQAGKGQVLIEVSHCGICGSDMHFWRTGPFQDTMVLGHEWSGTILDVGQGVHGWEAGQRVSGTVGVPCGVCPYCRQGDPQLCDEGKGMGTGRSYGAYAQRVALSQETIFALPDHVSFQQAATLEPLGNGLHAARKSAFRSGDGVAVIGAGPIGLGVTAWLRKLGASKIVVSEPAENRRLVARAMGAHIVVDPLVDDLGDVLRAEFEGVGPQLVFECVGRPDTIQDAFFQVRKGGEVVIMGLCLEPITINPVMMITRELRIRATYGTTKAAMEETLAAIADGSLPTEGYVTREVALTDVPVTFEQLSRPNSDVKVLIDHAR